MAQFTKLQPLHSCLSASNSTLTVCNITAFTGKYELPEMTS